MNQKMRERIYNVNNAGFPADEFTISVLLQVTLTRMDDDEAVLWLEGIAGSTLVFLPEQNNRERADSDEGANKENIVQLSKEGKCKLAELIDYAASCVRTSMSEDQSAPDSIVGQLAMPIARYLRNVDGEDVVERMTPRFERFVVECYEAAEGKIRD